MPVSSNGRVGQRQFWGGLRSFDNSARASTSGTSGARLRQGCKPLPRRCSRTACAGSGQVAILIKCDNIGDVPFLVREYINPDGTSPFRKWLSSLPVETRARIQARVLRFEAGNLGDHKAVGDSVWEARLDFGPGYRLYFAKTGRTVILLLIGGDKRSQSKDISQAKQYWAQYLKESKHGKT